jgi:hypothetical protein
MKHFFLLFLTVFSNITYADIYDEFEIYQKIVFDKKIFLVGQNNSIWEIYCFDFRSQTWSEWWNSIEVKVQEELIWYNNRWQLGDTIAVEKKNFDETITENIHKKDLNNYFSYPYLLKNLCSNKLALARPISFEAFIDQLMNYGKEQFNQGYDSGYSSGYRNGYSNGTYSRK